MYLASFFLALDLLEIRASFETHVSVECQLKPVSSACYRRIELGSTAETGTLNDFVEALATSFPLYFPVTVAGENLDIYL